MKRTAKKRLLCLITVLLMLLPQTVFAAGEGHIYADALGRRLLIAVLPGVSRRRRLHRDGQGEGHAVLPTGGGDPRGVLPRRPGGKIVDAVLQRGGGSVAGVVRHRVVHPVAAAIPAHLPQVDLQHPALPDLVGLLRGGDMTRRENCLRQE